MSTRDSYVIVYSKGFLLSQRNIGCEKENTVVFGTLVHALCFCESAVCSDIETRAVQGVGSGLPHLCVIVIHVASLLQWAVCSLHVSFLATELWF